MTKRPARRRGVNRKVLPLTPLADKPFRRLSNPMSPVEILSPGQIDQIHQGSMRILE